MKINIEIDDYKIEMPFLKMVVDITKLIDLSKNQLDSPSREASKTKIAKMIEEIKLRKAHTEIGTFVSAEEYNEPIKLFDDKQNLIGWRIEKKGVGGVDRIPLISPEQVE